MSMQTCDEAVKLHSCEIPYPGGSEDLGTVEMLCMVVGRMKMVAIRSQKGRLGMHLGGWIWERDSSVNASM